MTASRFRVRLAATLVLLAALPGCAPTVVSLGADACAVKAPVTIPYWWIGQLAVRGTVSFSREAAWRETAPSDADATGAWSRR